MKILGWLKKPRFLTGLIALAIISLIAIAVAEQRNLVWANWTGLGDDSTTNIERDSIGKIVKTVEIQQSGKTIWDLLQLFGTLALPVLLLVLANRFQEQQRLVVEEKQKKRQEEQEELQNQQDEKILIEKERAEDDQREQALENYLDRISDILLNQQILNLDIKKPDEARRYNTALDVIRARTLSILRRFSSDRNKVDSERKASVLLFLYDTELICVNNKKLKTIKNDDAGKDEIDKPLLNLKNAEFNGAYLPRANLLGASLSGVNLSNADLSKACLVSADLSYTQLNGADLSKTKLAHANLTNAIFDGAVLKNVIFQGANLGGVDLGGADLSGANFQGADLGGVDLGGANLSGANLNDVDISNTNLRGAIYDDRTRLQKGVDPRDRGMVKAE